MRHLQPRINRRSFFTVLGSAGAICAANVGHDLETVLEPKTTFTRTAEIVASRLGISGLTSDVGRQRILNRCTLGMAEEITREAAEWLALEIMQTRSSRSIDRLTCSVEICSCVRLSAREIIDGQ